MVKKRFEDFWKSDKSITEDIFFAPSPTHTETFIFGPLGFVGEDCEGICVTGHYSCRDASMAINFQIGGIGAIRRYCLGGQKHGNVGRYHEHILKKDGDAYPGNNLPYAERRDDLKGITPLVAWRTICEEAKIAHSGIFKDPTDWCT